MCMGVSMHLCARVPCIVCACSRKKKRFLQTSKNAITGPGSRYRSGLLSSRRIYDFEKAGPQKIEKNFLFTQIHWNGFSFNHFRRSLCNFTENLIAVNNAKCIFKMHNHLRRSKICIWMRSVSALRKLCKTSNGDDYW